MLIDFASQNIGDFLGKCVKSGILDIPSTKFIGEVISRLIIEFIFRLKPGLPLGVILNKRDLFVDLLLVEDVVGGFSLGTFILHQEIGTG